MRNKLYIQVVAAVVVTVFAVGIWSTGDVPKIGWLRFFSLGVWIAFAVLLAWDKVIWHFPWIQKLKAVPRDIRGTWKGSLNSQWIDEATGRPPEEKDVFLVVRQDASTVSVVLLTDQSRSCSSLAEVVEDRTAAMLHYLYLNRPQSRVENRSRIHPGAASLDLIGRPVTRLSGHYWTDRNSRGELEFSEKQIAYVDGFVEAKKLFAVEKSISPAVALHTQEQGPEAGPSDKEKSPG
jgi:hypothetical protein